MRSALRSNATHRNIEKPRTDLAERLFSRKIARDVEKAGYTHFWYYTTAYDVNDRKVAGGGTLSTPVALER